MENQTKTIREWLQELPDGYRELALEVCEKPRAKEPNLQEAILGMCVWSDTPQGHDFWRAVRQWVIYPEECFLPPLPKNN